MKPFNQAKKYGRKVAQVATGLAVTTGTAMAALPAGVGTAITEGTTDGKDLAYQLLGLAVAVGVILWLKRKA
jgi:hypothetical protein